MSGTLDAVQRRRNLLFMCDPRLWPAWPFLPLVRRHRGTDDPDCGLLCDLEGLLGLAGYRCTVHRCNLFCLPPRLQELLDMPRETFDTFEELLAAGWRVD